MIFGLNIEDMKCGVKHTMILTSNGEVYVWGENSHWQIDNDSNENQSIPLKLNNFDEKIVMISCGDYQSMALTKSGCVYSWGENTWVHKNYGNPVEMKKPKLIEADGIIINKISCSQYHGLLLSDDGDVYVLSSLAIGNGLKEIVNKPMKMNYQNKISDIRSYFNENTVRPLFWQPGFWQNSVLAADLQSTGSSYG